MADPIQRNIHTFVIKIKNATSVAQKKKNKNSKKN